MTEVNQVINDLSVIHRVSWMMMLPTSLFPTRDFYVPFFICFFLAIMAREPKRKG